MGQWTIYLKYSSTFENFFHLNPVFIEGVPNYSKVRDTGDTGEDDMGKKLAFRACKQNLGKQVRSHTARRG